MSQTCPCGLGRPFSACCEPFIKGELAPTPEALMRSRYSAYATNNIDYIVETTDPQGMAEFDLASSTEWAATSEFIKLEVIRSTDEGNKGTVEFKCFFKVKGGEPVEHHEISKFRKQGGRWFFRDGRIVPPPNPK